ncbi:MAG: hypothetical protein EOO15_14685 [Chitinophagaceae bacterium]|nr:MAG: hypothetical protein EOO15_14685 [Chitinophagaceae bacterium]
MTNKPTGSYFSIVSVLLLVLSIVAFSDNLFTDVGQPSNSDPKFIVHGLFGLVWYVLLATQANLVRTRNLRLHRKIGIATFIVAIGVTLSTLYIFVVLWKGWENMEPEVRANRLLLPGYALALLLAWQRRGQSDWHKRLIFIGTFFMLGPVVDRAYDPLIMSWSKPLLSTLYTKQVDEIAYLAFRWGSWIGFFLSMLLYDRKNLGRTHPVTLAGCGWFVLVVLISEFS